MTQDRCREAVSTYRCIYCCGQQWKLGYIDRSDRITTTRGARHRIGDGTHCIEHMTQDRCREAVGTYRCIYCCGQQWKLGYIDGSDRITTCCCTYCIYY